MSENRYKDYIRTEDDEQTITEPLTEEHRYKDHIRTEDAERPVEESTMGAEKHQYKDHIRTEDAERPVEEMDETHTYKDYIRTEPINFSTRRESFIDDMHDELDEWDKRMKRFEADMVMANEQAQQSWRSTADTLRERRQAFENRLNDLANASEDAWDELSEGVKNAWNELSEAISAAEKRFQQR